MVPAMDRSSKKPARWLWIGVGLVLAASEGGCSQLSSGYSQLKMELFGRDQTPAEVGQATGTTDFYAQAHRPRSTSLASETLPVSMETGSLALAEGPDRNGIRQPARSPQAVGPTSVALQRPEPIGSTIAGVPNASRILASAERRPNSKPIPTPAQLVAEARTALDAMSTYQVALHRQENVNGVLLPEEDVVLAIRREPLAIRLTWPTGTNQGREVLFRSDEPGGQMRVKMANPALPRLSFAPESPIVMRNSRHPVTEAGFDSLVQGLESALNAPAKEGLNYSGLETPDGFDHPLHCLSRLTPAGENWRVYLDPQTHIPALVHVVDARGALLERYSFRDLRPNLSELATADAFDPNARWGQPRSLLSRLARGDQPSEEPSPH